MLQGMEGARASGEIVEVQVALLVDEIRRMIPPRLGSDPLDPAADEWKADQSSALAASSNGSGFTLGGISQRPRRWRG